MKFIALLFFPVFNFSQIKLEKITFLDNKVEILAPKELSKMTDAMWALKYHEAPRPILVLTDDNGEVNLMADMTEQPAKENQLGSYKDFRIAHLKETRQDIKIINEGIKTVHGKKVGYFKFSSQAVDQGIFNYYFFVIVNGKILAFTFNCIQKSQPQWEKSADEIMASVTIK